MTLALALLGFTVVGAIAVFAFQQFLTSVERGKSAELAAAEADINADEVELFIRARDRFAVANQILDEHVMLSRFFDVLESVTLVNVRFGSFTFTRLDGGIGEIRLSGSARSFNALAAQSAAFSSEKRIKRAIFSGIQVAENGTVRFEVSAELDPKLIEFTVQDGAVTPDVPVTLPIPVATTTATTTPLIPPPGPTSGPTSSPQL